MRKAKVKDIGFQICQCIAVIFGWESGKWIIKNFPMRFGEMVNGEVADKLICIAICIVVTVITNRIITIHTFKVIDGYIDDTSSEILKITKESTRKLNERLSGKEV